MKIIKYIRKLVAPRRKSQPKLHSLKTNIENPNKSIYNPVQLLGNLMRALRQRKNISISTSDLNILILNLNYLSNIINRLKRNKIKHNHSLIFLA